MSLEELKKEWERAFDEEYGSKMENWTIGIIAETLDHNRNSEFGADASHLTVKLRKNINLLLAKQQEEFKDRIILHINDRRQAGYEDNTIVDELANPFVLDDLLADIKSKLNK